jgi:hypothetical protein
MSDREPIIIEGQLFGIVKEKTEKETADFSDNEEIDDEVIISDEQLYAKYEEVIEEETGKVPHRSDIDKDERFQRDWEYYFGPLDNFVVAPLPVAPPFNDRTWLRLDAEAEAQYERMAVIIRNLDRSDRHMATSVAIPTVALSNVVASARVKQRKSRTPPAQTRRQSRADLKYLTTGEFMNARDALCFALHRGIIPNVELTINWTMRGAKTEYDVEKGFARLATGFRLWDQGAEVRKAKIEMFPWLKHLVGQPFPHVTIFENSPGMGIHSHSLIAVPPQERKRFEAWLKLHLGVSEIAKAGGSGPVFLNFRASKNPESPWFWFSYMAKSVNPRMPILKWMKMKLRSGGKLTLKRVRISTCIGRAARAADKTFNPCLMELTTPAAVWSREHYRGYLARESAAQRAEMADLIRNIDKYQG